MTHHLLFLQPTDVLFFRDGRPMDGASSGHGAAWPLPHVLDSALHHALRRAEFTDFVPHIHTVKRSGEELNSDREKHGRQFGSLQSAGPFPIHRIKSNDEWLFPRPADAGPHAQCPATYLPLKHPAALGESSLPTGLHPVVNTQAPSKQPASPWITKEAYQAYLSGSKFPDEDHFVADEKIIATEHTMGIGIDPETATTREGQFYTASYLRLKPDGRLGLIAACHDKGKDSQTADTDLLDKAFLNSGDQNHIIAGGQQRTCTVTRKKANSLPLPTGKLDGFHQDGDVWLVKWVLLSPAIFPELPKSPKNPTHHPGGWLPSWIHPDSFAVQLKDPQASERGQEGRTSWRKRVAGLPSIKARLVATLVQKPIPVTGWALTDTDRDSHELIRTGGARATHLAVPAGSVYYFECCSAEAAKSLAAALNWHGSDLKPTAILNRRSALMGEKGYGLGVCGTWNYRQA